jgi:hypothetical protein
MKQVLVYKMHPEECRVNASAVELPVTIEMSETAAREILATLRAIPKNSRDEHTLELVKQLKKVLK